MPSQDRLDQIESLEELYEVFDELSIEGGWHRTEPSLWPQPRETMRPMVWHYAEVKPVLDVAGRLIDHSRADRRNVTLTNSLPGNVYATVRTLVGAYQMIKPGETAKAHRHTPSALRIILDGHGTFTVVNGTRLEMRPGDVLLTPGFNWHEHSAVGPDDCYWVDVLDVPLVRLLEPMFFDNYPTPTQPDPTDVEDAPGAAFRWEESLRRLGEATAAPQHGMAEREIELTSVDGGSAMATVALHVQQMSAGFVSATSRTTASSLFVVLEGAGRTVVSDGDGSLDLPWSRGDVIAVPLWRSHRHEVSQDAVLVRVSDLPVLTKLNLLRTEQLDQGGLS